MSKPPNFNSAHALDRAARAHPDRVSIYYGDRSWTLVDTAVETRRLAQLLASSGVSRGDRVALIAHNSPYHLLLHVACARIGAIFVPISYRYSRSELADLIEFSAPRVIVAEPEVAELGTFESTGTVIHFVIDDDDRAPSFTPALNNGYFALSAASSAFDGKFITDIPSGLTSLNSREYPRGPAAILFTSGSTGRPKAVALTHEQLWWGSRNFREGFEYSNHDVELVVAPLTHIGGFNGTTMDLFSHGGTVVIVREFEPAEVLRRLEQHRVAIMFGVPTMYAALVGDPLFASTDLSHFRLPLIGGAQSPPALLKRLEDAGLAPLNVWGMTEVAASGCYLPAEHLDTHRGSIGRPFSHIEARVVDTQTGEDSSEGELLLRGPSVVTGYWHDDELGRSTFRNGWLHTGDIVRQDSDGYLWVVGRLHNQINTGGEKVTPEEVVVVLAQHPSISDCAVVGVKDELWGERVSAVVVLVPGAGPLSLAEVQRHCAAHLARYKLPRDLRIVEGLPVNGNGKVDNQALAALFD